MPYLAKEEKSEIVFDIGNHQQSSCSASKLQLQQQKQDHDM
jgi:hypothetical protein